MSPSRRSSIKLGAVAGVVGMIGGAFLNWSATERRLSIHIATADDRVLMMCELAEYQMSAAEAMCRATGVECPARPPDLQREVLSRRCRP